MPAIQQASVLRVIGGTVYDALLARRALKARADTICDWNVRHFQQLGPEVTRRLKNPMTKT